MKRSVMGLTFVLGLLWSGWVSAAPPALVKDADTKAWWATIGTLAGDDMEGRDTGSAAYARAAKIVAARFAAADLTPASGGDWFQTLTLREARVETDGTSMKVVRDGAQPIDFKFLHEISVRATFDLPAEIDAAMSFRGYCSPQDMDATVLGKVLVCFGNRHPGLPRASRRRQTPAPQVLSWWTIPASQKSLRGGLPPMPA